MSRAIGFVVSWLFRLLGAFILLSVAWVLAYRFLPVPMTWLWSDLFGPSIMTMVPN